jgi:hypothetical protein
MATLARELPAGLVLGEGSHDGPESGFCVMEAVGFVAGERWSDRPECACRVIASFLRSWNDGITDAETRTRLLAPLVVRLVGSRSTKTVEQRRAYMALDWLVREQAAISLEQVPALVSYARSLRDLPEITAATVGDAVEPIRAAGAAARDAARDADWDADWDAARAAAWAAARDAARAAARAAAGAAAGDAARAAARAAAGERLASLVADAQQSALGLVDRMLSVQA